ncbi:hypothetical protein [Nocardiopsis composta]|uniref:hypothetical protein n=1 Tax=Nocardiopsis composta TaxID=157465 RepID=UPI00338AF6C2
MSAERNDYESAVPQVRAYLARFERAIARTWSAHAGEPYDAVRRALVEALRAEGAESAPRQVIDEVAERISAGKEPFR